jgi:hypothetical protein
MLAKKFTKLNPLLGEYIAIYRRPTQPNYLGTCHLYPIGIDANVANYALLHMLWCRQLKNFNEPDFLLECLQKLDFLTSGPAFLKLALKEPCTKTRRSKPTMLTSPEN